MPARLGVDRAEGLQARIDKPVDIPIAVIDTGASLAVDPARIALLLTRTGDSRPVYLLCTPEAIRLCREGEYEQLPRQNSIGLLEPRARLESAAVRSFALRSRLCSFSLREMSDAGLFLFLRAKLRSGDLVVVRFATKGARQDEGAARQRRLVRQIEAKSGRRLSYQGRTYRLTVDVELSRLLDRDSYQVMSHREAVAVLLALAKEGNGGPELGGLLSQAADLLTRDWRPPHEPNGLVLLRRYPVQQASLPDDGPAVTPSQLKKLTQTDWIEIELVDEEGQPYSTHYRLELTDNALREGELGTDGFLGAYEIASGQCKLTLRAAELPPTDTAEEADQEAGATEVIEPPADLEDELPPASLPSATVEAEQHWIEILLVNEQQAPLPNVEVCLTVDGQSRKAVADGNGRVRINDLPGDSAKLELSDPESLRIQLRDSAIAAAP